MRVGRLKAISYIDGQSKRILIVVIHPVCVCMAMQEVEKKSKNYAMKLMKKQANMKRLSNR